MANNGKNAKTSESLKGNTNAEKWTEETVLVVLNKMIEQIDNDHGKKFLYLGSLLYKHDLYMEIWAYWSKKFAKNQTVFKLIKKIDAFFEARIVSGAMEGELNSTAVIFTLKNKYGWRDRKEIDHSGAMSINNMSSFVDEEE